MTAWEKIVLEVARLIRAMDTDAVVALARLGFRKGVSNSLTKALNTMFLSGIGEGAMERRRNEPNDDASPQP